MNLSKFFSISILFLLVGMMTFASGAEEEPAHMTYPGTHGDVWKLEASDPLLIGGYGDNFVYDGQDNQKDNKEGNKK